jgi:diaminohydroxyphosphoribosylaminopyrimidine deaminase/5-amino-6-(5-phosphoribosylamino)uracil reductase
MPTDETDLRHMRRALQLAERGRGHVEPNPMVGCVIARGDQVLGEGWHQSFGGPHAEIVALAQAGEARGATLYVTLEPCCHQGKTPPCTQAVIGAGIARVVVAQQDPFPQVAGRGLRELQQAGLEVSHGLLQQEAQRLNAAYLKLVLQHRPWIIAKWAMTLDGKLATHTGHSQWISCEESRRLVHEMRGQVDGVMVGSGTVAADDPRLTARPPGPRRAVRILVDSQASLSLGSQLLRTLDRAPLLVAVGSGADPEHCRRLQQAGCELLTCAGGSHQQRLEQLLDELGRRRLTRVLVEGGAGLLGNLLVLGEIDEVQVFIASKLVGGHRAPSPIGGAGVERLEQALQLEHTTVQKLGDDVHVHGWVRSEDSGRNHS